MRGKKWAEEDEKTLKRVYPLYLQGLISKEELEKIFNRSFPAIEMKACRLRLTQREFSTVNKSYLHNLLKRRKIEI